MTYPYGYVRALRYGDGVATYDDVCEVLTPLWGESFGARLRLATLALAALADDAVPIVCNG